MYFLCERPVVDLWSLEKNQSYFKLCGANVGVKPTVQNEMPWWWAGGSAYLAACSTVFIGKGVKSKKIIQQI